MINSVMNRLQDFTFFSQLMANANMGWWKANLSTANYECSDFIVELLGLDQTGVISFEDFNKTYSEGGATSYDCPFFWRASKTGSGIFT